MVVHAEGEGGGVHDAKLAGEGVAVGEGAEADGGGILLWVGGIDAVDLGGLKEDVGTDFVGAEGGGGVGAEIGVSGAGAEDEDAALFEVAHGAALDEGLGDLLHGDGGLDAGGNADLLKGILDGEGVDDGGQHAHVVAGSACDAELFADLPAEDVPAAEDDGHFDAHVGDGLDAFRHEHDGCWVNAMPGFAVEENLSAELQKQTFVFGGRHGVDSMNRIRLRDIKAQPGRFHKTKSQTKSRGKMRILVLPW